MTSQLEVGFVCQFVTDPPETIQSECLACRQIIRNPFQATCVILAGHSRISHMRGRWPVFNA